MDIEQRFNDIIFKYNLDRYYPRFRKRVHAEQLIATWVEKLAENQEKVLCIGTGQTDIRYFSHLTNRYQDCFRYILYNDIKAEEVQWNFYSRVILISLHCAESVGIWLRKRSVKYGSIYDYLACAGVVFEEECYRFTVDEYEDILVESFSGKDGWRNNVILEIFFQQKKLQNAENMHLKTMYLEKLFFLTLYMKDFVHAEEYVGQLESMDSCDSAIYVSAWKDIRYLLKNMKEELKKRKSNDVVMYWIDALSYGIATDMPYLQGELGEGVSFENAFTVTPYTHAMIASIFCGLKVVSDYPTKFNGIGIADSHVIQYLEENGYVFEAISGYMEMFDGALRDVAYHDLYAPSSEIFWNLLKSLLIDNKKKFLLVHALIENHFPHLFVNMQEVDIQDVKLRHHHAREALDTQMRFYNDFLSEDITKIIMSDHGQGDFRERFQVYMSIISKKFQPGKIHDMFSLIDFYKLLRPMIEKSELNSAEFTKDYVEIESMDWYNYKRIAKVIKEKQPLMLDMFGYFGVVTKQHFYLRFNTGKEWLVERDHMFLEPNLFNSSNDVCEESLLPYFRELTNWEKIDIYSDERFKYARFSYKLYEKFESYERKVCEIINSLFYKYQKGSLAIRMGGRHSAELCGVLTGENRDKILCIVDQNPDCICGKLLEYPVISLEEMQKTSIKAVILSSYDHLEELKKEAKIYREGIEVLDLYDYMEKQGIFSQGNFYEQTILRDEDYDVGFPFAEIH